VAVNHLYAVKQWLLGHLRDTSMHLFRQLSNFFNNKNNVPQQHITVCVL